MQNGLSATLKDGLVVSYITKPILNHTIQSSNHTPWYLPKCVENLTFNTKICIWMFIAAFFIIAKTWKQLRCPSVGDWINKLFYSRQ